MAFPALASGCAANIPYVYSTEFLTASVKAETGWQYAYSWRANALYRWVLQYSQLSDADWATLLAHFQAMFGRYGEFEFTDPETTTVHSKCRYDQDELERTNSGVDNNSLTVVIVSYA